ncbi:MAG: hypothetical protein AAGI01_04465, partial [Myxococcota bacterium]
SAFWGRGVASPTLDLRSPPSARPGAILEDLGPPPMWQAEAPLDELLAPIYRAAEERGLELIGITADSTGEAEEHPDDTHPSRTCP